MGQSIDLSANSTITGMQATISLMPNQIMQTVNNTYGGVKTTVEQNASSWSAKVDQNGVINAINVSTEGAKINASKIAIIGKDGIDLKGYTTINNGFSIDNNGYMTAKNGGSIAGWTIGTDTLYSGTGASRVGLRSGVTGDNVVIYAGSSTLASAPFRVTASGKVTCTNLTVTGGSISGTSINIGSGAFTVSTAGAVSCSNLTVTGGSISGASINIGNGAFQVTTAGVVTCSDITATGGKIGGWKIDQYGNLYSSVVINGSTFYTLLRPPTSAGWSFRSSNMNATSGCFIDFGGNMVIGDASTCVWNGNQMTVTFTQAGQICLWRNGRATFSNNVYYIGLNSYNTPVYHGAMSAGTGIFRIGYCPESGEFGPNIEFTSTSVTCNGALYVTGNKPRIFTTKTFDTVILSAYETTTPMFGDVGEGVISQDGCVYIAIDPIYEETVSTNGYHVFIQKYSDGDCWVERYPSYFVVHGTPGLVFSWEIKARQKDLDQDRLKKYHLVEEGIQDKHTVAVQAMSEG